MLGVREIAYLCPPLGTEGMRSKVCPFQSHFNVSGVRPCFSVGTICLLVVGDIPVHLRVGETC